MVEIETLEDESKKVQSDDWTQLMGDDLVMKIVSRGRPSNSKDPAPVQPNDAVMVDFVGSLAENQTETDGPIIQEAKGWFVVIGEGDVLPALEMAIRFMDSGSTAVVWSNAKYAFSAGTRIHGNTRVPPNSNIMFQVTVTQIVVDTSRLNPYFTIQKAVNRKNIANDIYQHEWCPPPKSESDPTCEAAIARALRLYKKAAQEMEKLLNGTYFNQVEEDHPQRHQVQQVMLDSLNNIVAVYLRQKEFHKAKQAAVEVLKQDPKNVKALLRAAKASLLDNASTMEEVQASLDAAEEEITYKDPKSEKELKRLKAEFKRNMQEYKKKTKAMFAEKLATKASLEEKSAQNTETEKGPATEAEKGSATETEKGSATETEKGSATETEKGSATETETGSATETETGSATEAEGRGKALGTSTASMPEKANRTDALEKGLPGEDKEQKPYWKSRLRSILIQVLIALGILLLFSSARKIGSGKDGTPSEARDSADTSHSDL